MGPKLVLTCVALRAELSALEEDLTLCGPGSARSPVGRGVAAVPAW